jgi:Holliday junction resolvase RusA-like endonuclease
LNTHAEGPLSVSIQAVRPRPKSHFTTHRTVRPKFAAEVPGQKQGDVDNIAKLLMDALQGVVYHNDSKVISLSISKAYSDEQDVLGETSIVVTAAQETPVSSGGAADPIVID